MTEHRLVILARPLIARMDRPRLPVRPVDGVPEQGQRERVRQGSLDDALPVAAVQLTAVDEHEFGVCPVEALRVVVDGETVGPEDVLLDEYLTRARQCVHPRALDLRRLSPVRPVHVTATEEKTKVKVKFKLNCVCVSETKKMGWEEIERDRER